MALRINYRQVAPEARRLMLAFDEYASTTEIDPRLRELIKIRASQINGCAYCLDLHTRDAISLGESLQRIFCLSAWRETTFFTGAEQAALELTEAVTRIADHGVPDEVYQRVRRHFGEKQTEDLVILINTINSWNRIAISMHAIPPERTEG